MVRKKERVKIEQAIIRDANKTAKAFTEKSYRKQPAAFERKLFNKELSIEKKKKQLMKDVHDLVIGSFSFDPKQITAKKQFVKHLGQKLTPLRLYVNKLRDINYYLKNVLLADIGILKKKETTILPTTQSLKRELSYPKQIITKKDIDELEKTVGNLFINILFLDSTLLKGYKGSEEKIAKEQTYKLTDLALLIDRQSDLLCHLEAKFPPRHKMAIAMIKEPVFSHWIARIFALLAALEHEFHKETIVFTKLKRNRKLKKTVEMKIKHIVKEKENILKAKEKRVLIEKKTAAIGKTIGTQFHTWAAAENL